MQQKPEPPPEHSEVANVVARLTPEQRELLVQDLAQEARKQATLPPVERAPLGAEIPCSFAQQRLWLVDQLLCGEPLYNVPIALRIRGELNADVLERVLGEFVRRHEVLRTVFREGQNGPVQVIQPWEPLVLRQIAVPQYPPVGDWLRRLMHEEARYPFNLSRGPLLRATLFRLYPEDHVFLLVMHHIICDGWSVGVATREIAALYEAHVQGRPSPLPELELQYGDFAYWQRRWLDGETLRPHLDYWRQQLKDAPAVLALPTDRPRSARARHKGALEPFTITTPCLKALYNFARSEGVTLFVLALAAFKTLLFRYSGQTDICVGTSVAGRGQLEVEGLFGFFVNSLPIRSELSATATVRETLRRVREGFVGAYQHSVVPFEKLVEEVQPERDLSYNPLFQVMLVLLNATSARPYLPGLEVEHIRLDHGVAKFDLTFYLREEEDRITGEVEYSTDLFDRCTIQRMLVHFRTVLESMLAHAEARIGDLPLLTASETETLTRGWNSTGWQFPASFCMHELFEARAIENGEAASVIFGGTEISYADLNARANRLAHHLRSLGVGPEVRVGILLGRVPETVVAMLAILKGGGAYVPLDPAYPPDRLAYMLHNCRADVLITQERFVRVLPEGLAARVLLIDGDANAFALRPDANPQPLVSSRNTAYVIYTSGSTGQPKGVVLDHLGRVNNILDINARFGVGPSDRLLSLSSVGFDMFVYDTFGMLMSGGAVVLPSPAEALDPHHWIELIQEHSVTVWNSAPVLMEMLASVLRTQGTYTLQSLRLALLGGDWIPVGLPERVRQHAPNLQVISLGGATEASIHSTIYPVGAVDSVWESIPYGKPMANQTTYVLDDRHYVCPIGVPGELYLGGIGLAFGYFDHPELTAERFLPNPHGTPGGRMYRTGDIARWNSDGTLKLIGRADRQVKIRGFRVELGEVVAALRRHRGVRDAVVVAAGHSSADKHLVAYVVPCGQPTLSPAEMRAHLRVCLPEYMVPASFVVMQNFPMTPNGKVDWKRLPDIQPVESRSDPPRAEEAPALQAFVARIVGRVLGLADTALDENIFEIGAHSLLVTQIVSQLRETLGLNLPIRVVFEQPTALGIATELEVMAHRAGRSEEITNICEAFLKIDAMPEELARNLAARTSDESI